jgi:predicted peroxiredoxin
LGRRLAAAIGYLGGHRALESVAVTATRSAVSGVADAVACDGCPPLARLFEQFAEGGGELLVCPIYFNSKKLDEAQLVDNARLAGATPLWQWIGEGAATVFSY